MKHNSLIKIGAWLLALAWVPLIAIEILAALGIWPDKNPNPVGLGLLSIIIVPIGMLLMIIGSIRSFAGKFKDWIRGGPQ